MLDFQKLPLKEIKELYARGGNIMEFFRHRNALPGKNTLESILVSYDFQAGSYTKDLQQNREAYDKYTGAMVKILDRYIDKDSVVLDAGTGEATTLAVMWDQYAQKPKRIFGFDLSWSRVKQGREFISNKSVREHCQLFVGDLFNMAIADNSVDIVYTCHSLEPNSGREEEAIKELSRVAKKYLVLFEPGYELANEEARARMKHHGYITNLRATIEKLGLEIVQHELIEHSLNPASPTAVFVVKLNKDLKENVATVLSCPITHQPLELNENHYFSRSGFFIYPVIQDVPCLLPNYAILATQYKK